MIRLTTGSRVAESVGVPTEKLEEVLANALGQTSHCTTSSCKRHLISGWELVQPNRRGVTTQADGGVLRLAVALGNAQHCLSR